MAKNFPDLRRHHNPTAKSTLKRYKFLLYFGFIQIIPASCTFAQDTNERSYYAQLKATIGYDINNYSKKYVLEKELEEISGLSYYKKNQLMCVEDEDGKVFIYDLKAKKIIQTVKFGKKGDYEGVETVGKEVFVLRSDGKVFNFSMQDAPDVEATSWKTPLSEKNDVEGLGYLKKEGQLLLACKEKSKVDDKKSKGKAIYQFDTKTKKLLPKPFLDLKIDELNNFLESKQVKFKKIKEFKPSAVATHPKTQQTFVIASVGKLLVILGKDRSLKHVIPLNPKIYVQPEGICFAPDATMYISSEGQDGEGYILEFSYR